MTKPKVLFFHSTIVTGGAERHTVLLAKALMKLGLPCNILGYYAHHSLIIVDDEIRPFVHFVGGNSMRNLLYWPRVWSIIRKLQPDVVVCTEPSAVPIMVAGRAFGQIRARLASILHVTMFTDAKMRFAFPVVRAATRREDCLIYVCNAQRDYWENHGLRARDTAVIHVGIDASLYAAEQLKETADDVKTRLGFSPGDYVIGLTAVFRPEKNHLQAVEALSRIREKRKDAKLLFVGGDGETRQRVLNLIAERKLEPHVRLVINPDDVRPYLKAMDVGILCSTTGETFSQAALEMMAMNVPMVMPRMSGCSEMLVDGRGGRIFEMGDTGGLVSHLCELSDRALRAKVAAEARDVVVQNFTHVVMVDKYRQLFERLCA
jgi:glycosyltransferase involved in cell wall biosynthesis